MDGVAVPVASYACEAVELVAAVVDPKPYDRGGCGDGLQDKQRRRGEDFDGEFDQVQVEELEESLVAVEDDGGVEEPFCAPFCVEAVLARRQCQLFPTVLSTNPRDIRHPFFPFSMSKYICSTIHMCQCKYPNAQMT